MGLAAALLRKQRITHAVLIFTILFFAGRSELTGFPPSTGSTALVSWYASFAIIFGLVAYQLRRKKLAPALEKLRHNSKDAVALKSWGLTTSLTLVLVEIIGFLGALVRVAGASRGVSCTFYLVSSVLVVIWRPRMDLNARDSESPAAQ
jgi:hypothetical protein